MESQRSQLEKQPAATPTSCRKKKNEHTTFLDVKEHIDEFMNASMDEHASCFKKTTNKMFKMSKVVAEKKNAGVESSLPLQTTEAD